MTSQFDAMKFKFEWREYQQRALNSIEKYLDDNRINIVAAPGAGKTVLGLELIRRIGKPCLVLTPTRIICDQWLDRLSESFLAGTPVSWVSEDPNSDAVIHVTTYQNFYLNHQDYEGLYDLIVLDEAHHLRNAWWDAIIKSVKAEAITVISLTGTPPYDSEDEEWTRYQELCGEIDIEISPAELVKRGDLSPYQDLIYLVPPQEKDIEIIEKLRKDKFHLFQHLRANDELLNYIQTHSWFKDPRRFAKEILLDPERYIAMLIYASDADVSAPKAARKVLAIGRRSWPRLSWEWLRIFLQNEIDYVPPQLLELLSKNHALDRDAIVLPPKTLTRDKQLRDNNAGHLQAIVEILGLEKDCLGDKMKAAILTDHVGKAGFKTTNLSQDLSTSSIFKHLLVAIPTLRIAVLTGSAVVVPAQLGEGFDGKELPMFENYSLFEGAQTKAIIEKAEDAMTKGEIDAIIGTRALLGQGWDLPALNTLVLATKSRSFVSTNQMRGRVMRNDPNAPHKSSNIWHIASYTDEGMANPQLTHLGKRFDTFARLNRHEKRIESGMEIRPDADKHNPISIEFAKSRDLIGKEWSDAFLNKNTKSAYMREITQSSLEPDTMIFPAGSVNKMLSFLSRKYGDTLQIRFAKRAAMAVIVSLKAENIIRSDPHEINIQASLEGIQLNVQVDNVSKPEEVRIHQALSELFGPIETSRYLLMAQKGRRRQYFAIPSYLNSNRKRANVFLTNWRKYAGSAELVYTLNPEGRAALLRARMRSPFSSVNSKMLWS